MTTATPSILQARVEPVGGGSPSIALAPRAAQLTLDRTWSPYIQGSIVVPLMSASDKAACDPRAGLCVKFTLAITVDSVQQTFSLITYLRSATSDFAAGTTTLTFASGESTLQDFVLTSQIPSQAQGYATNDVSMVNAALNAQNFYDTAFNQIPFYTLDGTAAQNYTIPANTPTPVGQSAWDYILAVEEPYGLWVRGDENGNIVRSAGTWAADTSTHYLSDASRIVNVLDVVSRDDPNWGNEAIVQYAGTSTSWDFTQLARSAAPAKYAVFSRGANQKASGSASALQARSKRRGRALTITAIADLSARPNQTWQASFQGYTWQGIVRSVAFDWATALMTMILDGIDS